jgi:hypothetical protein
MVTVETSETPFLIQLEGANDQTSLKSEEYLKQHMVATKRVQITYRWVKTGYGATNGKYVPNERVIVVDRAPETREWLADSNRGTSKSNQAIWVESSDSVGFSTGISITARIQNQDDAVKFLYNYPPKQFREVAVNSGYKDNYHVSVSDLSDIMDSEIRTKIQEVFAEKAAEYNMDNLRAKKNEIITEIRNEVIPFFQERGITITAIGMFGGFRYENPDIQTAIDKVFEAQQDEEVAKAEAKAAEQRKLALQLVGEGQAQQAVEIAKGEAQAIQAVADAKAYELEKLTQNPEAYIALKNIEVEMERLQRWDGKYPVYYLGGGEGEGLNMFIPSPKISTGK